MDTIGFLADAEQAYATRAASHVSLAQQAAAGLLQHYFKRDLGRAPRLWLVYDARTHTGLLLALGQLGIIKQLATAILGEYEAESDSSNRHETCFGGYEWQHTLYR